MEAQASYTWKTREERKRLAEQLYGDGWTMQRIAEALHVSHPMIVRDLAQKVKFERESRLVERLLLRLGKRYDTLTDPNGNEETGIDVLVRLSDGHAIGLQVTELDPHPKAGLARREEKLDAPNDPAAVYGGWAQNDSQVYLSKSLVCAVTRKAEIAERHSFEALGITQMWLLVCAGIPEPWGAAVSTSVMTPWLHEQEMEDATAKVLAKSKYDCCFFLPILGAERALYRREKDYVWKKSVLLDEFRDLASAEYIRALTLTAASGDRQEMDRLCEEECKTALRETREAARERQERA
jgi:hypothetical protein